MFQEKKVAFHTLGCKLNFSETSTISRQLADIGFKKTENNQKPDLFVLNIEMTLCQIDQYIFIVDNRRKQNVYNIVLVNQDFMLQFCITYSGLSNNNIIHINRSSGTDFTGNNNKAFGCQGFTGHMCIRILR